MKRERFFEKSKMIFDDQDNGMIIESYLGKGESGEGYRVSQNRYRSEKKILKVIRKPKDSLPQENRGLLITEVKNNRILYGQGQFFEIKIENKTHNALLLQEMPGENYDLWLAKNGNHAPPEKLLEHMQNMMSFTIDALKKGVILTDLSFGNWKVDNETGHLKVFDLGNPYQSFTIEEQLNMQMKSLVSQFDYYIVDERLKKSDFDPYRDLIEDLSANLLSLTSLDQPASNNKSFWHRLTPKKTNPYKKQIKTYESLLKQCQSLQNVMAKKETSKSIFKKPWAINIKEKMHFFFTKKATAMPTLNQNTSTSIHSKDLMQSDIHSKDLMQSDKNDNGVELSQNLTMSSVSNDKLSSTFHHDSSSLSP